jgi:hypothetical protein
LRGGCISDLLADPMLQHRHFHLRRWLSHEKLGNGSTDCKFDVQL